MPRIYASNNDPYDLCRRCWPKKEEDAEVLYRNNGTGPDGRGDCFTYDADHPPYGGDMIRCDVCGKLLIDRDNWPT